MPSYATRADVLAYTEGLTVTDNAAFDRIIERAERDVDSLLATPGSSTVAGPKLAAADLTVLSARDRERLRRATCAQTEYRVEMGEAFFARHQYRRVTGPDFSTDGTLPYIGPKVLLELEGFSAYRVGADWVGVAWT